MSISLDRFEFDLGARLRAVREMHGLSQRELARRAGVTNGSISLIEGNKSSPSVASLKKVLDGIPMDLGEFFALGESPADKVFFKAEEFQCLTEGNIDFCQVGGHHTGHNLQMLHELYAPGADTGKTMLSHEGEECGIVLRGRIEITVGKYAQVLGPGEGYYFDSRLNHRFRNAGSEECEIVSTCTPPYL
ncbi:MAG: cupin domain-containing protein [Gammaproteobacteria bacterium]|nr:cupin domain-containing protein [Gammaproteobacteria bacterium]